jgi:hypothetical protein
VKTGGGKAGTVLYNYDEAEILMQTLMGPFGIEQLLQLVNNPGVRAPLRRFAAKYSAVFVNNHGKVVLIVRDRKPLSITELSKLANDKYPGVVFFITETGQFSSVAALQEKIEACVRAFKAAPPAAGMEERVVDGEIVLVIGSESEKAERGDSH